MRSVNLLKRIIRRLVRRGKSIRRRCWSSSRRNLMKSRNGNNVSFTVSKGARTGCSGLFYVLLTTSKNVTTRDIRNELQSPPTAPFFRKGPKGFVHLSELEFTHDSTELKRVWLCARCSFISLSQRKGTKETRPSRPPFQGRLNLLRAEATLRKGFCNIHEAFALKGESCIV